MAVPRTKWVEREFSFDFPLGLYASVVERVRGLPARLEDLLRGRPREALVRRDGGRWSMQEHAGHLLDLEELGLGRLDDFEAGLPVLRAADMTNRKTHEADHNAVALEDILIALRRERAEFVRRLDAYDEGMAARTATHPRLKTRMRVVDLAYFIAEHDDHHLASVSELIRLF
ncbi:MAG TPA: DinB family protein [Pyrinomonadaceae bacterium]|nr:DinB family protein [Pyrinomonadaceae bacterium]